MFGEQVSHGVLPAVTPLPLLAVAAGVFTLSRSPILRATWAGPARRARKPVTEPVSGAAALPVRHGGTGS